GGAPARARCSGDAAERAARPVPPEPRPRRHARGGAPSRRPARRASGAETVRETMKPKITPAFAKFMETPMTELLMDMFLARRWKVSLKVSELSDEEGKFEVQLPDGRTFEVTIVQT